MEFKDRIKKLRLEYDLSYTQLASRYGKSEAAVRSWETGRTKPDADTLIKLSEYFDCSIDYLLGLSDIENPEHAKQLEIENEKIWQIIQKYRDYKFRDKFPAYPFLLSVLSTHWFSYSLGEICDYVMFDEENADDFRTMTGTAYKDGRPALLNEIEPEELLSHFLFSAQNQIGNVCKYLRDKRLKGGEENAET